MVSGYLLRPTTLLQLTLHLPLDISFAVQSTCHKALYFFGRRWLCAGFGTATVAFHICLITTIMRRTRPQLSITLPRNFTFHYTEGDGPKTPEQEVQTILPQPPQAFRVKRRIRPSVSYIVANQQCDGRVISSNDVPIPTIETSASVEPSNFTFQQRHDPVEGYLAPIPTRRFMTSPRTPSAQRDKSVEPWKINEVYTPVGESIRRPLSGCSVLSDSSDDSDGSLSSYPSMGGSCTSPESEASDPFVYPLIRESKLKAVPKLTEIQTQITKSQAAKQNQVHWTPEMDRHLWAAYLLYLQDPTVTPFKTVPGAAPPLGVCHRVARAARRSWRTAKSAPRKSLKGGSPDTVTEARSGSNTPTGSIASWSTPWPKTGSSTRKRLRELCKRKPPITPHHQRLLHARSPSPETSSPRRFHFQPLVGSSSFATRDMQFTLTTSTAATMQPDGPLARLSSRSSINLQSDRDWFNDPIVPFASPAAPSSDDGQGIDSAAESMEIPRLGSPFGNHTWGPSRSRLHVRPPAPRIHSDTVGPSLKSPARFHDTFPYPTVLKRRAQHQLEDELSPGGTNTRKNMLEDLFGGPTESRHRRVRSRGFSLGDVNSNGGRLQSSYTPPTVTNETSRLNSPTMTSNACHLEPSPSISNSIQRLGSPFAGVSSRPTRRTSRHMASASLSAHQYSNFSSIDQTIDQVIQDGVWKGLRRS